MCFQTKRKMFTYLSMCSCCHSISKYSSVVKSHLRHSHANLSSRNVSKMVIPIRINSKYEKYLALKINKKTLSQSKNNTRHKPVYGNGTVKTKNDQNISKNSNKRKVIGEKSILCTVCKKSFNNIGTYFLHLSAGDHLNSSTKSTEDDVLQTKHSNLQCPYCPDIFNEMEKLYQHLGDNHCDYIELISIKTEEDDEGGRQELDSVIVTYKCQHCQDYFLGLLDFMQHVTEKHISSRKARKRKMPKWLQEYSDSERNQVKKSRNDSFHQKKLDLRDPLFKDLNRKESLGKRAKSRKEVNQNLVMPKKPIVVLENLEAEESFGKRSKYLQEAANNSIQNEQNIEIHFEKEDKKADKLKTQTKVRNESNRYSVVKEDISKNVIVHSEENSQGKDVESTLKHSAGVLLTSEDRNKTMKDETNDCNKDIIETDLKLKNASTTGLYKCPYCKSKEYHWLKSLKRHIRAKHSEYVKSEDQTEVQILTGHNRSTDEENAYEETLTVDNVNDEFEGDSDDDYIPEEDNTSESDLEKEKSLGPKTYKCKYCKSNVFPDQKLLQQHIKKQHPEVAAADQKKDQRSRHRKTNETEVITKFKCPFCAFSLYHREYVFSHIEKVHPEVSHFTLGDVIKKLAEINDNQSESECFQCPHCKYLCRWKSDLQHHCRYHHPTLKQPYHIPCILPTSWVDYQSITAKLKCAICNTVCEGKTNFENHMKDHVSEKRMNITFHGSLPEPDNIGKKRLKKKLTSFLCPFCDCVFKRKDSFIYHMKSHKGGTQKKEEIIAIKCVMLRKDLNILSTARSESSTNTADSTCINTSNEENVDDDNIKENGNESNSNVDNVASSSNLGDQESVRMDGFIKTVTECSNEHTNDVQKAVKENLNIVHIKAVSANENEKYLKPRLAGGSFICPVCDEFKTFSKTLAVKHVEDSHFREMSGIEILYILPYVYIDMYSPEKDEFVFGCESCSLSTNSIVDAVKHIKSHRNELEKERPGTEEIFKTKIIEPKLFDMVSLPSSEFGIYEEITYKCWSCDPSYLLKTRKGYRKHMLSFHEDTVGCEVGDVMNQMLEVIDGKKGNNYRCSLCNEIMTTRDGLIDHFKARYPDKVEVLMAQLNNRKYVENIPSSTRDTECEICYQGYRDDAGLRRHLLLHLNKARIHCSICGIYFSTKGEVANHSVTAHSISNFMCSVCGKLFCSNKDFVRHMRQHGPVEDTPGKNSKILCQHCGMELRNISSNIKRHQLRYHVNHISCDCLICKEQTVPDGVTSCVCTICKKVFCTNYTLTAHQKNEHSEQNANRKRIHDVTEEFKCVGCAMVFENHKSLQSHSHKCDKGIQKLEYMMQTTQHDEEQPVKSECEVKTLKKTELSANSSAELIKENFLVYNAGSKLPYGCSLCEKSFKILKYMYNHVRRTHASDATRRFRCKVCKMGFVSANSLKRHCKLHVGLRLHQCMYCKKSYKSSSHLREHLLIHTDTHAPKYTCGYCGTKFLQNGALLAHVVHHDKIRPYKCPFCQKSYTTSGDLKRHMDKYDKSIVKKDLKCSFCKKTFENTHYLQKHFQTHTVKDPFSCSVCQKKFSSFRQMYLHKDKSKHFTDTEYKEAREDLCTPGRMFRSRSNQKFKTKKVQSDVKGSAHSTSMMEKVPPTFDQESAKLIFNNESGFEIQVPDNIGGSQMEATKSVLSLFEENVVQSMIDVVESEPEVEKEEQVIYSYDQADQFQYVVEISDSQTHPCVPEIASSISTSDVAYHTETTTAHGDTAIVHSDNGTGIDELATLVSQAVQNEDSGRTRSYVPLIHVCVVKPTK